MFLTPMKSTTLASLLFLTAAACQNAQSKLDSTTGGVPSGNKGGGGKEGTSTIGGGVGGGVEGAAAMREVDALRKKVSELEAQLSGRIDRVADRVSDYDKYKTPLDVVAAKIKQDEGKYTIPDGIAIDARLKSLEAGAEKNAEMLEWLADVYEQQQQQAPLDPTGTWGVDISAAVKAGQVEGPMGAFVTIVEAWDYA
jgi:hypothetical protein